MKVIIDTEDLTRVLNHFGVRCIDAQEGGMLEKGIVCGLVNKYTVPNEGTIYDLPGKRGDA